MAKMCYVDVSRTVVNGKGRQKLHCVYDGQKIIKIRRLTKLRNAGEIYIDTLFPEVYDEVLELLKRGVKVYLLKYPSMLKKLRRENNVRKSDEVDAVMLSKVSREYFRTLTIQEMEKKVKVQPLINEYELLSRRVKILKQWVKNDGYDWLRDDIRLMEEDKKKIAEKIIEIFSDDVIYREACRMLGISESVDLAILLNGLRLETSSAAIRGYLGLTNNRNGKYNRNIRRHLAQLANVVYVDVKRGIVEPSYKELTDIIAREPKNKALFKLQTKILKILKNIWRAVNEVSDEPAGR
ncbi:MAG: hypothetical protein LZ174_02660 [Thaumarchaeota archaeon]|jgi:hypothetical protein|nr:hypothetical protein [Candidatus Geocrenenecus arthurdayi]